jgi:predicted RND superfamily exporter protein
VMGVQLASISGICFATMVQVPATFGAQFVMFLVLGIGLDGVFLMTDTFDNAPADLTLEERIQFTMCHAGPSIFIASLTDICAFLTAAFTPIPLITYFCITVRIMRPSPAACLSWAAMAQGLHAPTV